MANFSVNLFSNQRNSFSMQSKIEIIQGDITKISVDAIVNAANKTLLGGGGVDGAIHAAAGRELLKECLTIHGCETGQAKITKGYNLPAKYVIHTVGPIWHRGTNNEGALLASCYHNCLKIAEENNIKTIAFPSISTGVYGYPIEEASIIALKEIILFLETHSTIEKVTLVCFGERDYHLYNEKLNKLILNREEKRDNNIFD